MAAMQCPKCARRMVVFDSREASHGMWWRRYRCAGCGHRTTGYEFVFPETPDRKTTVAVLSAVRRAIDDGVAGGPRPPLATITTPSGDVLTISAGPVD